MKMPKKGPRRLELEGLKLVSPADGLVSIHLFNDDDATYCQCRTITGFVFSVQKTVVLGWETNEKWKRIN